MCSRRPNRDCGSAGLLAWRQFLWCGLPIPAPVRGFESAIETVVRTWQFPPYSRAAATVFHRLPVHGVSVIVNRAPNLRNTQAACAAGKISLLGVFCLLRTNCLRRSGENPNLLTPFPRTIPTAPLFHSYRAT